MEPSQEPKPPVLDYHTPSRGRRTGRTARLLSAAAAVFFALWPCLGGFLPRSSRDIDNLFPSTVCLAAAILGLLVALRVIDDGGR